MFKKILPLVALVAVVVFSSFTTQTTHKTLEDGYFLSTPGGWQPSDQGAVNLACPGGDILCAIQFPAGDYDENDALDAAGQIVGTDANQTVTIDENEIEVTVFFKTEQ